MNFHIEKPLYGFISTGEKTAMYTLRVMYSGWEMYGGQRYHATQDYYHGNLSTDKHTANAKALEYCKNEGIEFKSDASFDLNEIKRRTHEEVERLREIERKEREEAIAEYREKKILEYTEARTTRTLLCGKYTGEVVDEVAEKDRGYILWCSKQIDDYVSDSGIPSKFGINIEICKEFVEKNGLKESEWIGTEGDMIEVKIKFDIIRWTHSQFPSVMFVGHDESGNEIKFFTTSKKFNDLKPGMTAIVSGVVTSHDEWNDKKSTLLKKQKLIEVIE